MIIHHHHSHVLSSLNTCVLRHLARTVSSSLLCCCREYTHVPKRRKLSGGTFAVGYIVIICHGEIPPAGAHSGSRFLMMIGRSAIRPSALAYWLLLPYLAVVYWLSYSTIPNYMVKAKIPSLICMLRSGKQCRLSFLVYPAKLQDDLQRILIAIPVDLFIEHQAPTVQRAHSTVRVTPESACDLVEAES